ncbi:RidA family protein [Kordiimonas lacus]|uniref:Enamine deaminase RidA, house cleaning of reactive enamine intermediates, YjgF/YER057c/UK114 family n=1 Tax=Kordiimonas lacus TaxID=637679 RepID=A0A1G7EGA5_9PROT|nr:RidA family protein [Kordiimonas lacus]SDE62637.1 Enamine deaminase RidA, house cleaning of reactive enamine intermediates, YjgF/YER057c/UK114 family [Kordiimonas lacus]
MRILLPEGWPRPSGYSNGVAAEGRMVFVAGQVGWTPDMVWEAEDFLGQYRQTLLNTLAVLKEAGAGPEHIVRMTWYVTSREEYLANLRGMGAVWRECMGKNYPVMACVEVSGLMEEKAKIEIETTAVLPPNEG